MLRIVHPAREGQPTDPPVRRKGARAAVYSLTPDESRHLRASIQNAARAYGGVDCLAAAMGVPRGTLYQANRQTNRRRASVALALLVARAAGMSLEAVISGKLSPAGQCKACGARAGAGRATERAS